MAAPSATPAASRRRIPPVSIAARVMCALGAAGVLGLLLIAASLTPSPTGLGTHLQMRWVPGITPCQWLTSTGRPCITCGMTTAFAHAAAGEFASAFRAQPFGALLAIGCASAFWMLALVAFGGARLGRVAQRMLRPRILVLLAALALLAWAYKAAITPAQPGVLSGDSAEESRR